MFMQSIYGLSNPAETAVLYVGRSKHADDRRRHHVQMGDGDFTTKGIWVHYLKQVGKWPDSHILEEMEFHDEAEAEKWAKAAEMKWIKRLFSEGHYLFNYGCWWKHPDRRHIPKGVRQAWEQLHAVYFRLQFWLSTQDDVHLEITRFQAVRGIRALISAYPAIEIAPIAWIDPSYELKPGEDPKPRF